MKAIVTVLFACLLMACGEKDMFVLNGHFEGVENDKLLISSQNTVLDTIEVHNGQFTYALPSIETNSYRLFLINSQVTMRAILENGNLILKADINKAERGYLQTINIEGATNHQLANQYFSFSEELIQLPRHKEVLALRHKMISVPREQFQDVKAEYEAAGEQYFQEVWDMQKELLDNNVDKYFVTQVIQFIKQPATDAEVKALYNAMPENIRQHPNVVSVIDEIRVRERIAPGKLAPDFTLKSPEGEDISLTDLRGKYVLVDFWASWCKPCRASFPHMKELYNRYHSKGFEILGVACDNSRQAWLKALDEDQLPWLNVQEDYSESRSGRVIKLYGFTHLPSTILIDPNGKIIAKLLHGDELDSQLAEVFGF